MNSIDVMVLLLWLRMCLVYVLSYVCLSVRVCLSIVSVCMHARVACVCTCRAVNPLLLRSLLAVVKDNHVVQTISLGNSQKKRFGRNGYCVVAYFVEEREGGEG